MDSQLIATAAQATLTGDKPFPGIVGMLAEAGVAFYHVDYPALRKTFYSGNTALVSVPIPLEGLPPVAADFDAEALRASILDSQQNHQSWRDFSIRAMRGGVRVTSRSSAAGASPVSAARAISIRSGFRRRSRDKSGTRYRLQA